MLFRGTIAAAVIVPLVGTAGIAAERAIKPIEVSVQTASAKLVSAQEKEAMDFRQLQTELMVAALSCGRPEYRNKYNTFVVRYRPALKRNARILKTIFNRNYGSSGKRRLNSYVTQIANDVSVVSMERPEFCAVAGRKFNAVLGASSRATAGGLLQRAQRQ
ncbi:MAG TPA: hypothetical protein VLN73_02075 [Alphaproteobacteria bacterium]|nr:hypothetical protein [Alphaproteobacteria bacterium]